MRNFRVSSLKIVVISWWRSSRLGSQIPLIVATERTPSSSSSSGIFSHITRVRPRRLSIIGAGSVSAASVAAGGSSELEMVSSLLHPVTLELANFQVLQLTASHIRLWGSLRGCCFPKRAPLTSARLTETSL